MKVIRKSVFETNSSSTHSICISKNNGSIAFPDEVHFNFGEYGWEFETIYNTASYLYTAIVYMDKLEYIDKIKEILDKHGVKYTFARRKDGWGNNGYVDHGGGLLDLIYDLFNDEDKLLRFLFGDSVIYTGNDNCNWEDDSPFRKALPNHPEYDGDKYDYYHKGN